MQNPDEAIEQYQLANLMNDAFDSGVKAKAQQIRRELGL